MSVVSKHPKRKCCLSEKIVEDSVSKIVERLFGKRLKRELAKISKKIESVAAHGGLLHLQS